MSLKTLELDADDERDINAAVAHWQMLMWQPGSLYLLPDGTSCTAGAVLGEICRGWLESHGALRQNGGRKSS